MTQVRSARSAIRPTQAARARSPRATFAQCLVGVVLTATVAAGGAKSLEQRRDRCEAWLEDEYTDHRHVETLFEYVEADTYRYRANYDVAPRVGFPIRIGLTCAIDLSSGERRLDARERPHDRTPATPKPASGRERRLDYGAQGCPRLRHWKTQIDAGAGAAWPDACIWLEAGTPVFGPLQTARYADQRLGLIRLDSGQRYWLPTANL